MSDPDREASPAEHEDAVAAELGADDQPSSPAKESGGPGYLDSVKQAMAALLELADARRALLRAKEGASFDIEESSRLADSLQQSVDEFIGLLEKSEKSVRYRAKNWKRVGNRVGIQYGSDDDIRADWDVITDRVTKEIEEIRRNLAEGE